MLLLHPTKTRHPSLGGGGDDGGGVGCSAIPIWFVDHARRHEFPSWTVYAESHHSMRCEEVVWFWRATIQVSVGVFVPVSRQAQCVLDLYNP